MQYKILFTLMVTVLISQLSMAQANNKNNDCQSLSTLKTLPASSSQVILVQSLGGFRAKIRACQRLHGVWERALPLTWDVLIGENGIAPIGEKKEGDLKTPVGLYALGDAFGSQPLPVKMDYKYITAEDKFIDDPNHKDYNTWVTGKTDAKSFEPMLIDSYKMGLVINYNMSPIIPGAGSAIFIHLSIAPNTPTAGCITMDEPHLLALLNWLEKNKHPYISIN